MSGVIHKAGLFGFLRFILLFAHPDEWMGWTVLAFGALSAFFGVVYTAPQRDLKRLLGYSSTENVGIAAMGFGVGCLGWTWGDPTLSMLGFAGGIFHVFNHALFKCLSFYAAGAVYQAAHTVDLERLGGLARRMPRTTALFIVGALAGAALPPLNGFASELFIYAGLLSGRAPTVQAKIALVAFAAVLAFVGAVSALSITRAAGLAFLGVPRDPHVAVGGDPPPTMTIPMVVHASLVLVVGLFPELALSLFSSVFERFSIGVVGVSAPLAGAFAAVRIFGVFAIAGLVAWLWASRARRRSATWGCGYTALNTRMQYTGRGFAEPFTRVFEAVLPAERRDRLPAELFPKGHASVSTHHADAVERRMYEVLGQGEGLAGQLSDRIPDQPSFAFAAGLAALVLMGAWVTGGFGG